MFALFHGVPYSHIFPALFAVFFTFLFLKTKWVYLKVFFGLVWLLLLPNTAYIFTDITRITLQWSSLSTVMQIALIIQYICLEIIGLVTFLLVMLPFESIIHARHFSRKEQILTIILFNFLIGFGMVLGRTGYTNSYVVFTQPIKVFLAAVHIVTSFDLLGLTLVFGILCNRIYFLFRNGLMRRTIKLL